jgi:PAS domain S-box-containing protein
MSVKDLRPPEDVQAFVEWFTRAGHDYSGLIPAMGDRPWRHKKKDGSIIDVEIWRQKIRYRGVDATLAVVRDITETRRFELALAKSEKRFRALIENMTDGLALYSADSSVQYSSPSSLRMFGYKEEDVTGFSVFNLMHPDDRDWLRGKLAELIAKPRVSLHLEYRVLHRDGSYRWVDGICTNMSDDPDIGAIVVNFRDVTERKLAEQALRDSEERYRLLFEESPLPMLVYDLETLRVLTVNGAAELLYGYSGEEFRELTIRDIRPPEDIPTLEATLATNGNGGSQNRGLRRHRRRDGAIIDVEISSHPILFGGRQARIVLVLDVTEKRRLEEQLRQSQKMEAIGLLAGGVAHDFNNLLSIIIGATELAQRSASTDHPASPHLEDISAASQRAVELTRKLLALSRQQVLRMQTVELRDVVADFGRLLSRVLGEDIELSIQMASEPVFVRADVAQLNQVLLNLCTNARQAMPKGGRLRLQVRKTTLDAAFAAKNLWARVGTFGEILVEDSGQGMNEDTQARVFEPFFTTKEEGTGLGLPMVYGIVQQHHGCLSIRSKVGAGTTVRVLLPITANETDAKPVAPRTEELRGGDETLLVAEDEGPLRKLIAGTLSNMGYHVIVAGDGEEAARLFEERGGKVDLVILDVVMPKLGGPETYARMRKTNPYLKVIFTTGYAPDHARIAELVAGEGHRLLDKPFRLNDLVARVREVLDR